MRARAWAAALAALSACGGGAPSQPLPPTPPGVQVLPATPVVVGTEFSVDVQVTGCADLESVTLTEHQSGVVLGTLQNPGPRSTFTVAREQVPYAKLGIAATLDLIATAKCANGTSGLSSGVDQVFMPADALFTGSFPFTGLALDRDGSGLVACAGGAVVDLGTDGSVRATTGSGFGCTASGYAIHDGSTVFWLEPGLGVARLDAQLRPAGGPYSLSPGQLLLPDDPSAPAVLFDAPGAHALLIDRSTGAAPTQLTLGGTLDGSAGLGTVGLSIPEQATNLAGTGIELKVERFNLTTGNATGVVTVATVPVDQYGLADIPALNLSADGNRAYFVSGAGFNDLWVCPADADCGSSPSALHASLPGGPYLSAQPLGQNIVVLGPQAVLFTDASGVPVGAPITPSGGLRVLGVYPGKPGQFFMLDGNDGGQLLELVMFSAPGVEAARFAVAGTPFGADVDQAGVPYLLFAGKLARLLTPDQYLAAQQ